MRRKIALTRKALPQLREGHARIVHLTKASESYIESIKREGLKYGVHGMLSSTARAWANAAEVQYSSQDPRFCGERTRAVVMDLPIEELRTHEDIQRSPGCVPSKYLVGVVDSC